MPSRSWMPTTAGRSLVIVMTLLPGVAAAQALIGWTESQQARRIEQYARLDAATVAGRQP